MTSFLDDGPLDPDVELDQARRAYHFFKDQILETLTKLQSEDLTEETAKSAGQASKTFQQVLLQITKQEADLEKHRRAISGVIDGDALDLDAARAEIFTRLARYRDADADR